MNTRAFTIIELVITVSLTVVVLSVVSTIYVFSSTRLSDAYTKSSLFDQMNEAADRVEATIRNAVSCTTKDSGATLVCAMPLKGVDTDGDGHFDSYYPDSTASNGSGAYSVGHYVWFYEAGSSGQYGLGSGGVWRAEVSSGSNPGAGDIDRAFAYYGNSQRRFRLVNNATFSIDTATSTVRFTLTGSVRIGAETSIGASDPRVGRTVTVTRTVEWRN